MPNWCHDTLDVSGPEAAVAAFVEKVRVPGHRWHLCSAHSLTNEAGEVVYGPQTEAQARDSYWCRECRENWDGQPLTFAAHVAPPEPGTEEYARWGTEGKTGMSSYDFDWYGWNMEHWGTKWDASFSGGGIFALGDSGMDLEATLAAQGLVRAEGRAIYKFDTAWGPPSAWFDAMIEQEPELEFMLQFAEPGNDFAGRVFAVHGAVTEMENCAVEDVLAPEEMWF
jgi:hypothetical protein